MAQQQTSKIALVTGGSRGLGRASCLSLARDGIDVLLTYRSNQADGTAVVEELRSLGVHAEALQLDISVASELDGFVERVKAVLRHAFDAERIDFLVNNAGIGKAIPIDQLTEDDFDTFCNIHFKGVLFLTQKLLRITNDHGVVVFITAAGDRYKVPGYGLYGSCKGAIEVFSRYVAVEYGPRGIRANTVAPGGVMTDFAGGAIRGNPKLQETIIAQTPMGRLAEPNDIGALVALVCQDGSRWMTGQRLEATGGYGL